MEKGGLLFLQPRTAKGLKYGHKSNTNNKFSWKKIAPKVCFFIVRSILLFYLILFLLLQVTDHRQRFKNQTVENTKTVKFHILLQPCG